ncbi:MAG: protein translocase subunit SecD [bacterium]|nr:protein translocase subunit SecD [bacterium]
MKTNLLSRWILILIVFAGTIYYLYPSYRFNQLTDVEASKITELVQLSNMTRGEIVSTVYRDEIDLKSEIQRRATSPENAKKASELVDYIRGELRNSMDKVRGTAIKRGLDLQGGMYLVMEVDAVTLIENIARSKDEVFQMVIRELRKETKANPDLDVIAALQKKLNERKVPLNRYFGSGLSEDQALEFVKKANEDAVKRSLEILRNRIDQFGVSEPNITRQGDRRIVLELPGVQDPQRARDLIGKTALLEFKMLIEGDRVERILQDIDQIVSQELGLDTTKIATEQANLDTTKQDTTKKDTTVTQIDTLFGQTTKATTDTALNIKKPFTSLLRNVRGSIAVPKKDVKRVQQLLGMEKVKNSIPMDVEFLWGKMPEQVGAETYIPLYLVNRKAEMTGSGLVDARVSLGGRTAGAPDVQFELNNEGRRVFARVTGANIGKRMAIVLDNIVHMAPTIRSRIPDGRGVIEGSASIEEANDLAIVLRAGALPAPVEVIEERTVGPSLGRDSIEAGKKSFILAFVVISLFMIFYYRLSGAVASFAIIVNIAMVMAILALFQATLTVPGIAGLVLTMGMAVDANVLIYERIREELLSGKTPTHAVKAGFERAFITIFDSNLTTLFSGFALYQFGTGPVKGFATTLIIGIIVSMFTALYMSRAILDFILYKFTPKTLSV